MTRRTDKVPPRGASLLRGGVFLCSVFTERGESAVRRMPYPFEVFCGTEGRLRTSTRLPSCSTLDPRQDFTPEFENEVQLR